MNYLFLRFPNFKYKAVTLSYDDGVKTDRRLIEIMRKNGLKGTFNINAGLFAKDENTNRLTKEEAVKLYSCDGVEVTCHGYNHFSLAEIPSSMAVSEVIEDRRKLEEAFGKIITGMAYANGSYSDETVEILKACGINYSRTCVATEKFDIPSDWLRLPSTCHHNNPKLMELAKKFIEEPHRSYVWAKAPRLFYLWGHSYEFDDNNNWNVIEEFAAYVGNREDVWYATNTEIYNYVKAYEKLVISADGKIIKNPTDTDIYLYYFGKEVLVKVGETVNIG